MAGERPRVFAVRLARIGGRAAQLDGSRGGQRRFVFILRDELHIRLRGCVAEVVAFERRGLAEDVRRRKCLDGRREGPLYLAFDERVADHGEGVFDEDSRQFVGVFRKIADAAAEAGDVFQKFRITVRFLSKRDDGDGDVADAAFRQKVVVLAWLFRVRRVREKNDVAGDDVGFRHLMDGGHEPCVDINAAAHGSDAADGAFSVGLRADGRQRNDDVWRGIDGDGAEEVRRREQLEDFGGSEIGQIHFRAAVVNGHGHAARTVEHDDDGDLAFADFLPLLHRDGHDVVQRRFVISADSEGGAAASHEQAESAAFDELGDELHAVHAEPGGGNVFENQSGIVRKTFR